MLRTKIHILFFVLAFSTLSQAQNLPTVWGNTRLYARTTNGDTTGFITVGQLPFTSSTAVSGTTGYLARFATGTTLGNSVVYETSGSVGVNSANLYGLFTVGGASYINGASNGSTSFLGFKNATTDFGFIGSDNAISAGAAGDLNAYVYGNNNLFLSTNGVKRLTITGAGASTFSGALSATTGTFSGALSATTGTFSGAVSLGSNKITSLLNGSASSDAAAFGQIATGVNTAVNGTTNYLSKFTSSNVLGNSSIFESSGSTGIGTTTLYGVANIGGATYINGTSGGGTTFLQYKNNGTDFAYLGSDNAINAGAAADFNAYVFGNNNLYLSTNGVKRLTVSGAGVSTFSGSVAMSSNKITSLANGTVSSDAAAFGQIATGVNTAVNGTSTYIPKFNGTNSITNSQLLDNGTNIDIGTLTNIGLTSSKIRVGGTVNTTGGFVTSNNATSYSVLGRSVYAMYNNNVTGTLAIEMPVGWSSQTMNIRINGYDYTNTTGSWICMIGGSNFSGGYWANYSATFNGNAPFSSVRLAYNTTTARCIILLGTTSTVWNAPRLSIDIDGYGSPISDLSTGWSSSFVTSEAAYSSIVSVTNVGQNIVGGLIANDVQSRNADPSYGYVTMTAGTVNQTGYFGFWRPNGQRAGYIGFASNTSGIQIVPENGTSIEFQGNIHMQSNKITNLANATGSGEAMHYGQFTTAVSGTTNTIPLFTGTNAIGNSALTQSSGNVTASGTLAATRFISNIANGTQPYQTTSSTLNANLNANFVQGLDSTLIGQRTQKNTWTQSNTFTGTTNLNGATTNLSAALRSDYSDGSDNLVYGNSSNDLKYTSYQSILNRTQANDTFAMTTATHVFTLSTNQVNTVDIGIYTNILDTIDIRLASGFYDDNQMISITTDKSLIAGQGDKIKITNSSGVTQLEIVNDVTSTLTKDYEVNTTSFGKMNLQIQYSKKRAKWRIISFKLWDNL